MTTQATQQVAQAQSQQEKKGAVQIFTETLNGNGMANYLAQTLGEKKAEFIANVTTLVSNNQMLQHCDAHSVIFSALKATALDLPLDSNLGFAYVIPYNDKNSNKQLAQFQLGYKGFIQLAMRSGQFKTINVRDVREGEIVGEDFISGEMQFKSVEDRENKKVVGYVAFFRLINGFEKMEYWSVEKIEAHATKYSQTYSNAKSRNYSTWAKNFDAMARKTCIKLLLSKYAPMSVQMQSAIKADQAIITEQGERYIDNEPQQVLIPADQASKATDKVTDMLKGAFDAEVIEENQPNEQPKDTLFE
jgi:recombination protein RecT